MARYIIDHDTDKADEIANKLADFLGGITTVVCVDETNTNQFHVDLSEGSNKLTHDQVKTWNELVRQETGESIYPLIER